MELSNLILGPKDFRILMKNNDRSTIKDDLNYIEKLEGSINDLNVTQGMEDNLGNIRPNIEID